MGWGYGRRGFGWSPIGGILLILGVVFLFSKIGMWWILFPLFFFILPMLFSRMAWGHRHHHHGGKTRRRQAGRNPTSHRRNDHAQPPGG